MHIWNFNRRDFLRGGKKVKIYDTAGGARPFIYSSRS